MGTKIRILILFMLLSVFALLPNLAKAATGGGIQISPLTFNYTINPGEKQSGQIIIKNLNSDSLDYVIESEDFAVVSNDGAPSFAGSNAPTTQSSLAAWVTVDKDNTGTILPGAEKDVPFTITAPKDAEPGGHYAAIFAKQVKKTAEGQTEIGISSRVGTLILVSVPGDVKKGALIAGFTSPKIVWQGPVNFTMEVKNTGNIHFDSEATVTLKSLFGKIDTVDLGTHTILPNNTRNFTGEWSKKYPFGRYEITATASDPNGNPIAETAVLWAIPLMIVIPVIIGLILLILIIIYLKKHMRFVPSHEPPIDSSNF